MVHLGGFRTCQRSKETLRCFPTEIETALKQFQDTYISVQISVGFSFLCQEFVTCSEIPQFPSTIRFPQANTSPGLTCIFSPILNRSQTHQKNSMDKSTDQENLFSMIKKVIFFNSNKSVQSCPNPLFQTQRLLFLLARYFMEYLKIQVRTNKMVNE